MRLTFIILVLFYSVFIQAQQVKFDASTEEYKVSVYLEDKLFTELLYADSLYKPVLYPIYTASGQIITRGYPINPYPDEQTDHPHQIGLWFTFGDVNGIDFWNKSSQNKEAERCNYGTVKINQLKTIDQKRELVLEADWIDCFEQILLKEQTSYLFSGDKDSREIIRITHLTAGSAPVILKGNKEGLIGLRLDRHLEKSATGEYINKSGNKGDDVWGKRSPWVSLNGIMNNEKVSIALIDHPENPYYPGWSHARGYGLFALNNLGGNHFNPEDEEILIQLSPGESIEFKHKVFIKSGSFATSEELDKALNY